jgi:hypothetical protein
VLHKIESVKTHLALIVAGTILAVFSLGSIVSFTDPQNAGILVFLFLYTSIFLASLGLFTAIGILIRRRFAPSVYIVTLEQSFRQALLLSLLVTISFILQGQRLLFWWVELTLILFLICIEAFFNMN